jgi:RNA polymerase sigma factor (TIGR02999 family)
MSDVTRILSQIEQGHPAAADQLLRLVYDELRKLAAAKLAHEKPGQTLQATALVHEAYLRLVGGGAKSEVRGQRSAEELPTSDLRLQTSDRWHSRAHFFAAAAEAMRRILIERARQRQCEKRGAGLVRKDLDTLDLAAPESSNDLLALDDALSKLASRDPKAAELVKLRYFSGLTLDQVSQTLAIPPRTADRLWAYARAFLHAEIYEK